jgi:hypothetical protein
MVARNMIKAVSIRLPTVLAELSSVLRSGAPGPSARYTDQDREDDLSSFEGSVLVRDANSRTTSEFSTGSQATPPSVAPAGDYELDDRVGVTTRFLDGAIWLMHGQRKLIAVSTTPAAAWVDLVGREYSIEKATWDRLDIDSRVALINDYLKRPQ